MWRVRGVFFAAQLVLLTSNLHLRVQLFACSDYSCTAMEEKRGQPLCVRASARRRSQECGAWSEAHTKGENSELPHVFWKHKNEETRMETKGVRDVGGGGRKSRQLQKGTKGGEGATSSLAKRHVNGEWRASLNTFSHRANFFGAARSLSVPCSCCCVFSTSPNLLPPPPPLSLPGPLSVFCLLRLANLLNFMLLAEGFQKIRTAVPLCRILGFIKYLIQREAQR